MLSDTTLQWLADNGFASDNLDQPGRYQDTPIICASRRGEGAIVEDLLSAGVNVNHRNQDGTNALWAAVVANDFTIADRLLAAGADLDNQNDNGATALMYASSSGKTEWVRYFLSRGADTSLRSLDDFSALDLANNRDILKLLRAQPATAGAVTP